MTQSERFNSTQNDTHPAPPTGVTMPLHNESLNDSFSELIQKSQSDDSLALIVGEKGRGRNAVHTDVMLLLL